MMKKLIICFLAYCLSVSLAGCGEGPMVAEIGSPAPDFNLVDRTGRNWILSELKGQVVFINFWATWCSPCREEMPAMQKLYSQLPKDKFKMLAILNRDAPSLADVFVKKLGVTIPVLDDQSNTVGSQYGITGLPETFIVDKEGVLREKFIGPAQWDSPRFVQMLTNYMNE